MTRTKIDKCKGPVNEGVSWMTDPLRPNGLRASQNVSALCITYGCEVMVYKLTVIAHVHNCEFVKKTPNSTGVVFLAALCEGRHS